MRRFQCPCASLLGFSHLCGDMTQRVPNETISFDQGVLSELNATKSWENDFPRCRLSELVRHPDCLDLACRVLGWMFLLLKHAARSNRVFYVPCRLFKMRLPFDIRDHPGLLCSYVVLSSSFRTTVLQVPFKVIRIDAYHVSCNWNNKI